MADEATTSAPVPPKIVKAEIGNSQMTDEIVNVLGTNAENDNVDSANPFDDPIRRTRYLIQYIRMRKQRTQKELEDRNALRKQKKDAQATLQNARDSLREHENELQKFESRWEELVQLKNQVTTCIKTIDNKEERKRQREAAAVKAAEESRLAEEQQRMQAQQAAMAQLLGLDALILQQQQQQQLKSAQLLNALGASNGRSAQFAFPSSSPSIAVSSVSPHPGGFSPAPTPINSQQQQQQQNLLMQLQQLAGLATGTPSGSGISLTETMTLQLQHQQQLATMNNFLRQYGASSTLFANSLFGAGLAPLMSPTPDQSILSIAPTLEALQSNNARNITPNISLLSQSQTPRRSASQQPHTSINAADLLSQAVAGTGIPPEIMYQAILSNLGGLSSDGRK